MHFGQLVASGNSSPRLQGEAEKYPLLNFERVIILDLIASRHYLHRLVKMAMILFKHMVLFLMLNMKASVQMGP